MEGFLIHLSELTERSLRHLDREITQLGDILPEFKGDPVTILRFALDIGTRQPVCTDGTVKARCESVARAYEAVCTQCLFDWLRDRGVSFVELMFKGMTDGLPDEHYGYVRQPRTQEDPHVRRP